MTQTPKRSVLVLALGAMACLTFPPATRAAEAPRIGTFYSAQKPNLPPLPFNPFPALPVHQLDPLRWVYDDSAVNYEQIYERIAMERASAAPTAAPSYGGGPLTPLDDSGPGLTIRRISQGQIEVEIVNAPEGHIYDLYQTFRLERNAGTAAHWQKISSGSDGDIFTFASQLSSSVFFFLGDQETDQDQDGIPDAYEECVSKTSATVPDSRRGIYEAVIQGQRPSGWFKLNVPINGQPNDGLVNAVPGRQPLVAGGTVGVFDNDLFATGNGAYSFPKPPSSSPDPCLTLTETETGDRIGGGTGDAVQQGSFTFLFRALNGQPASARYLLSQGIDVSAETGDAIAVYVDGTGLNVGVGSVVQTILGDANIARGAWYYLGITCDETRADNQVRWYLARVGSDALQSGSFTLVGQNKTFGNNGVITVGNQEGSTTGGYYWDISGVSPSPRNGYVDQVAFWERELAESEITAQFYALPVSALRTYFNLANWELMLPVNNLNQLGGTPLNIGTGWLNSDFEYVDPLSSNPNPYTKKYFYRGDDNTMVFEAPYNGAFDGGSSGPRSELRGTKTDGNQDNWTLAGTHTLEATNVVIEAGDDPIQPGPHPTNDRKVIIGQIHGKSPNIATFTVNYNYPHLKDVSVAYYPTPSGGTVAKLILAQNVNVGNLIYYKVQLHDDGTTVTLHGEASIDGVAQPIPSDVTLTSSSSDAWHGASFYFKAGCYYPSPVNGTAKVTFSSLSAKHQ
jgi:hypothetical protein